MSNTPEVMITIAHFATLHVKFFLSGNTYELRQKRSPPTHVPTSAASQTAEAALQAGRKGHKHQAQSGAKPFGSPLCRGFDERGGAFLQERQYALQRLFDCIFFASFQQALPLLRRKPLCQRVFVAKDAG